MSEEGDYPTEAEKKAYHDGLREGTEDFYELEQVRKIACAFIESGEARPWTTKIIADEAWRVWRAIKAEQEGKP